MLIRDGHLTSIMSLNHTHTHPQDTVMEQERDVMAMFSGYQENAKRSGEHK